MKKNNSAIIPTWGNYTYPVRWRFEGNVDSSIRFRGFAMKLIGNFRQRMSMFGQINASASWIDERVHIHWNIIGGLVSCSIITPASSLTSTRLTRARLAIVYYASTNNMETFKHIFYGDNSQSQNNFNSKNKYYWSGRWSPGHTYVVEAEDAVYSTTIALQNFSTGEVFDDTVAAVTGQIKIAGDPALPNNILYIDGLYSDSISIEAGGVCLVDGQFTYYQVSGSTLLRRTYSAADSFTDTSYDLGMAGSVDYLVNLTRGIYAIDDNVLYILAKSSETGSLIIQVDIRLELDNPSHVITSIYKENVYVLGIYIDNGQLREVIVGDSNYSKSPLVNDGSISSLTTTNATFVLGEYTRDGLPLDCLSGPEAHYDYINSKGLASSWSSNYSLSYGSLLTWGLNSITSVGSGIFTGSGTHNENSTAVFGAYTPAGDVVDIQALIDAIPAEITNVCPIIVEEGGGACDGCDDIDYPISRFENFNYVVTETDSAINNTNLTSSYSNIIRNIYDFQTAYYDIVSLSNDIRTTNTTYNGSIIKAINFFLPGLVLSGSAPTTNNNSYLTVTYSNPSGFFLEADQPFMIGQRDINDPDVAVNVVEQGVSTGSYSIDDSTMIESSYTPDPAKMRTAILYKRDGTTDTLLQLDKDLPVLFNGVSISVDAAPISHFYGINING